MNIRWLYLLIYLLFSTQATSRILCGNIGLKDGTIIGLCIAGYEISYTEDKKKIVKPLCFGKDKTIKAYTADDFRADQAKIFALNFQSHAISSQANLTQLMKQFNLPNNSEGISVKGIIPLYGKTAPDIHLTGWMGVNPKSPLDNQLLPRLQRKDLDLKDDYSTQMALVNLLLHWEKNGLIQFPKTSSEKKKHQALYKIVNLKKSTRSSKTNWQNVSSSLLRMTTQTLKGEYAIIPFHKGFEHGFHKNDLDFLNVLNKSPYQSTCFGISLIDEKFNTVGSQALNVISIDGEDIELQGWGVRFTVRVSELKFIESRKLHKERYVELIPNAPALLPKWIRDKKLKLCFKDQGDGIYYFQLLQKVKAGMEWNPPAYASEANR